MKKDIGRSVCPSDRFPRFVPEKLVALCEIALLFSVL